MTRSNFAHTVSTLTSPTVCMALGALTMLTLVVADANKPKVEKPPLSIPITSDCKIVDVLNEIKHTYKIDCTPAGK